MPPGTSYTPQAGKRLAHRCIGSRLQRGHLFTHPSILQQVPRKSPTQGLAWALEPALAFAHVQNWAVTLGETTGSSVVEVCLAVS